MGPDVQTVRLHLKLAAVASRHFNLDVTVVEHLFANRTAVAFKHFCTYGRTHTVGTKNGSEWQLVPGVGLGRIGKRDKVQVKVDRPASLTESNVDVVSRLGGVEQHTGQCGAVNRP